MKKIISYILAVSLLFCSTVTLADETKEIIIDTQVPEFNDLEDRGTYRPGKTIEVADLSKVRYAIFSAGNGTKEFLGEEFSGYNDIVEYENHGIKCNENYVEIATIDDEGEYLVYAIDEYGHSIAVRFYIEEPTPSKPSRPTTGGGGGGGGGFGGTSTSTVKPPYANGNFNNTGGSVKPGEKIVLDTDTGNADIYYTIDGSTPDSSDILYDESKGIVLEEGQTLKAVTIKSGNVSEVSVWKCEASGSSSASTPGNSIVKDVLETENHIVYMTGYPDGNFGANDNMTRAEAATMLARLIKEKMNAEAVYEATFPDIDPGSWYSNYVGYVEKYGIITGYEDGTYGPLNTITRAEFVTMVSRFADISGEYTCEFTDVSPEHWAYKYIAFAASNGWINGYEDKTFRPNDTITRAEVVTIVNNMLAREADKEYINAHYDALVSFGDVDKNHWAYYDIMEATNEHDYSVNDNKETWK